MVTARRLLKTLGALCLPARAAAIRVGLPARGGRGFSLLEVMMSVAILSLVLTVILSAQGGLAASNKAAGNMGMAITAARCKMTEAEEKLLKFGYPEIEETTMDSPCCENTDAQGFTCDLKVEKVVLPNPPQNTLDGGSMNLSPAASGASIAAGIASGAGAGGAIGQLLGAGGPAGGAGLNFDGGLQGLGASVGDQFGGGAGVQGMLQTVLGFIYPTLKPMMETSIRRITIVVHWSEGPNPKKFTLTQFVTNPQRGGFINGVPSSSASGGSSPPPTPGGATGGGTIAGSTGFGAGR